MGKKFILSFSLIIAFVAYAFLYQPKDLYVTTPSGSGDSSSKQTLPSSNMPVSNKPASVYSNSEEGGESEDSGQPTVPPLQTAPVAKPATPSSQAPSNPPVVTAPPPVPKPIGMYRDGQYTGSVADAYYGNVQVKAIIQSGKITDVQFLDYPQDRGTSREINAQAMPYLTSEAIQAQNANVDTISGATETSRAFVESLGLALTQAKN